jgi:integrase
MAERITDKLVRSLEPPETGNRVTYDTEIPGFGVRVTARGAKGFILNYRTTAGRERRLTIGAYGIWTVAAARDEAKALKRRVNRGEDPMGERHDDRRAPTMKDLCNHYIENHLPTKRRTSQGDDLSQIRRLVLPRFGQRKVADITQVDIAKVHRALKDKPVRANRHLALLSKMFSMALDMEWIDRSPVRGVKRYYEEPRERFLSQAEIARLSEVLADYSNQTVANAIRFLLLTGCRRGEALAATWDQFDLEAGTWTKPSAHTKIKKTHRIPLSAPVLELLSEMKEANGSGDFVFPGRKSGTGLYDLKSAWRSIQKRAGLEGVHMHDLRHTFASILASEGLSLPIVGALLGHTQTQTTARYAHLFDEPLREATERVGKVVKAAGKESAEVVQLKRTS